MAPVLPTLAGLATALLVRQATAQCQNPTGPGTGSRVLADGYEAKLLINGLRAPRHMAIDQQGNLLVAEQGGGGIRRISFQDNGSIDVCVTSSQTLIPNSQVSLCAVRFSWSTTH